MNSIKFRMFTLILAVISLVALFAGCSKDKVTTESALYTSQETSTVMNLDLDGPSGYEVEGRVFTPVMFYIDDTSPYELEGNPLKTFLDFAVSEGIKGEASFIPGFMFEEHGLLTQPVTDTQKNFIEQVKRAYECGIDTHFELMTHMGLYDFKNGIIPEDSVHEGLWIHQRNVSIDEYERYFRSILDEANNVGIKFTGVTWPGCDCEKCKAGFEQLERNNISGPNPNVWEALLRLAQDGKFRGNTVSCFTFSSFDDENFYKPVASDGEFGVYDLVPNAGDWFGSYDNDPGRVSADYYITEDGSAGRIVELVEQGAPYCLFYTHWQGMNPADGKGWEAFQEVMRRINKHLKDDIIWMRPSEYTEFLKKRYK